MTIIFHVPPLVLLTIRLISASYGLVPLGKHTRANLLHVDLLIWLFVGT